MPVPMPSPVQALSRWVGRMVPRSADPADTVEPAYQGLAMSAHAALNLFVHRDYRGQQNVPQRGGVLFVANHISNFDPLVLGEYLIWSGRWPRYLGKEELWHEPVVGWFAAHCGQIPIHRTPEDAQTGLQSAVDALQAGRAVTVYPEATITGDEDTWPMVPRSGAARIALASRAPVVPIGQIGANEVIRGKQVHFPRLLPRKTMHFLTGEPVDLSDLYDAFLPHIEPDTDPAAVQRSHEAIVEAGWRMVDAITALVEQVRDEQAPADRFDWRTKTYVKRPAPPQWLRR